ncbi:hypothetical protein FB45DRAFT_1124927 [Roridomyces roridus]|uniref:THIF-type NAD/FAD binding fold domain-containing protein n=1 Tax=Roridomyces roridus TaxID=1738132 RepID=A0AAD7FW39_9AGAR|nr:hypothetical protein FB45DRAFT_1124927 [Roridomyces roridus]
MDGFNAPSHRAQLISAAVIASATTAALISLYSAFSKRARRHDLDQDILRSISRTSNEENNALFDGSKKLPAPTELPTPVYDEDLIQEQLARNYAFFGDEAMAKIRGGTVVVVGCGGVGSWAAVMLVRSFRGVSKIRLIDFDYVTLSSLNRHATATLTDVGTPKVKHLAKGGRRGSDLNGADWVVDKSRPAQILPRAQDKSLLFHGRGRENDPTRIQISDISYTIYDPLARSVRRGLRLKGVTTGIPVVYSTEVPSDVKLLPLPEEEFQKGNVKELGVFDDFRVRILPVLGPLPALFGLHIATYILCALADKPIANPLPIKNRRKVYGSLLRDLLQRESRRAGEQLNRLPISEDDVGLIFEDVYRGRSVIPPHLVPVHPMLVRWDPASPVGLENCVPMERAEAQRHERETEGKTPEEVWGDEVAAVVEKRRREIRAAMEWVM